MRSRNVDVIAQRTSPKCEAAAIEDKPNEGGSRLPTVNQTEKVTAA